MRQDQFERMQALSERLTDVFINEADPDKWPGHGIEPGAMDQQTRGDRYWCKKNAVATLSIVQRVANLTHTIRMQGGEPLPPASEGDAGQPDSLDEEVRAAEQEAERLLSEINRGARKSEFDKRVHKNGKG